MDRRSTYRIRQGFEPSSELKAQVMRRAARLTPGKKTFGTEEMTTTDSIHIKENAFMTTNEIHEQETAFVKNRTLSGIAAAAAIVIVTALGAVTVTMFEKDNTLEQSAGTYSAAGNTAAAQMGAASTAGEPKEWAKEWLEVNDEVVGYISIPGLVGEDGSELIDSPVFMHDDNEYYLTHGPVDGTSGSEIFADKDSVINSDGTSGNITLYGLTSPYKVQVDSVDDGNNNEFLAVLFSNEKHGKTPFEALSAYNWFDIVRTAPVIEFKTIYQDTQNYAVVGIFPSNNYALEEFEPYTQEWLDTITDNMYFSCGVSCTPEDDYLMLKTVPGDDWEGYTVLARRLTEKENIPELRWSYKQMSVVYNFSGNTKEQAIAALTDQKLDYELRDKHSGKKSGTIVGQSIEGGTLVEPGTKVILYVSLGDYDEEAGEPTIVPDLKGLTRAHAIAELKERGFEYEFDETNDPDTELGIVAGQSVAAGETAPVGSTIVVYVSTGQDESSNDGKVKTLTMRIPFPEGISGSYTIDVYRNSSVAYTKTVQIESAAGGTVDFDIAGKGTERLAVYVRNNDLGAENYIRYAMYDVDYDKKEIKLQGELNESDLQVISGTKKNEDPVVTLTIPIPEEINGKYRFDVLKDGKVYSSATVDAHSADTAALEVSGIEKKDYPVYIKRLDVDEDNYIIYGIYSFDFDKGTAELSGKANTEDWLKLEALDKGGTVSATNTSAKSSSQQEISLSFDHVLNGSYTVDLYDQFGELTDSKTVENNSLGHVGFTVSGQGIQTYTLYLKRTDVSADNYIRYVQFIVNFDDNWVYPSGIPELDDGERNDTDLAKLEELA